MHSHQESQNQEDLSTQELDKKKPNSEVENLYIQFKGTNEASDHPKHHSSHLDYDLQVEESLIFINNDENKKKTFSINLIDEGDQRD
jgi:hypothetical protein